MKIVRKLIVIFLVFSVLLVNITFASETELPTKYDLRDDIELVVKNQESYGMCVEETKSTVLESFVKLKKKKGELDFFTENPVFSIIALMRHNSVVENIIPVQYVDEVISNYTNGEMNSEQEGVHNRILDDEDFLYDLEKITAKYQLPSNTGSANKFVYLDGIYKKIEDNQIHYYSDISYSRELTDDEVQERRNTIKETIMNCSAIGASCDASQIKLYTKCDTGEDVYVLNCSSNLNVNHSVTIIGWDDNFSRMNFPESCRPNEDGAYIVQNSWGSEWGNNGYFYISYEDVNVEGSNLYVPDIVAFEDIYEPIIIANKEDSSYIIRVTDCYGSGIKEQKYKWTDHNIEPSLEDEDWVDMDYKAIIQDIPGKYLWVYASDNVGLETLKSVKYNTNDIRTIGKNSAQCKIIIRNVEKDDLCVSCDTLSQEEIWENYSSDNWGFIYLTIKKPGTHKIYFSKYVDVDGERLESRAKFIELVVPDPNENNNSENNNEQNNNVDNNQNNNNDDNQNNNENNNENNNQNESNDNTLDNNANNDDQSNIEENTQIDNVNNNDNSNQSNGNGRSTSNSNSNKHNLNVSTNINTGTDTNTSSTDSMNAISNTNNNINTVVPNNNKVKNEVKSNSVPKNNINNAITQSNRDESNDGDDKGGSGLIIAGIGLGAIAVILVSVLVVKAKKSND